MITDQELLRRYVREDSEEAFAEVVRRHVSLVYGAALRQLCGHASLAEDATQAVFTALATRARTLLEVRHLSSWLLTVTRYTASHLVRAERRRQDREQKAHHLQALLTTQEPDDGATVPPELWETALAGLDERDREVVLRRFFEGQSFADLGLAVGLSEDAARMRVTRALEKIRAQFARHGITSSAAALAVALAGQASAAPAGLAASVSTAALVGTAAFAAAAGAPNGILALMTTAKTGAWLAGFAALAALATVAPWYRAAEARASEIVRLPRELDRRDAALPRSASAPKQSAARVEPASVPREISPAPPSHPPQDPGAPVRDPRTETVERMARMKPLLAQGMPIKGAIVVLVDGKAVQRPVEFVMGRETRVEAVDDGTYLITPDLNPDGSVRYRIVLQKKDGGTGGEKTITLSDVVQTPWAGFTLAVEGGNVMGFDPDKD